MAPAALTTQLVLMRPAVVSTCCTHLTPKSSYLAPAQTLLPRMKMTARLSKMREATSERLRRPPLGKDRHPRKYQVSHMFQNWHHRLLVLYGKQLQELWIKEADDRVKSR